MAGDPGQIDPTLRDIGQAIGLLDAQDNFQVAWLEDPVASIGKNYSNATVNKLTQILENLLGGTSGSSLGVPVVVGARTWYPIQLPPSGDDTGTTPRPLGLYFVTEHITATGEPTTDPDNPTVFGLGLMPRYDEAGIRVAPYAYVPLLVTPTLSAVGIALETMPIELGLNVTRADGSAFGESPVTFTGLALSMQVFVNGTPPVFGATLTQLALPGTTEPSDYDLLQIGDDVDEWIRIGVGLVSAQLASVAQSGGAQAGIGAVTEQLLGLLGLAGNLPAPDWSALGKESVAEVALDWLAQVVGSPTATRQWLYELYFLFQGKSPDGSASVASVVAGSGTPVDPWSVPLFTVAGVGSISFTAAVVTATSEQGERTLAFYPGVTIASEALTPLAAFPDAAITLQGAFTLLEMTLAAPAGKPGIRSFTAPSEVLFPTFQVGVVACNTTPGKPLISATDPTVQNQALFAVGSIRLGMAYDQSGATITPQLQLTGVVTEQATWDSIDLLNAADDIAVGKQIASQLISGAIGKFLGLASGGSAGRAAAVAAALGIAPPPAYQAGWPIPAEDLLLGANALQGLVADPLRALAAYQSRCLSTPFPAIGASAWKAILPELGAILTGTAADISVVTGDGTPASPWRLPLASLAGGDATTTLNACQVVDQGNTTTLQLSLESGVTLAVGGFAVDAGVVIDLFEFTLPQADGSQPMAARALGRAAFELTVTPPATPPSVAGIALSADQALVSLGWSRADGFQAAAGVEGLALVTTAAGQAPVTTPIGTLAYNTAQAAPSVDWNTLSQAVVNVLGTVCFQRGGPIGVLAATSLGWLPDVSSAFDGKGNPALKLPANWPVFKVSDPATFFQHPWADLQAQVGALFGDGEFAEPLMRLVGWSLEGKLPDAPGVMPAGTIDDPWTVTLDTLGGIEPLVWREPAGAGAPARVGFGLQRGFNQSGPSGMQATGSIRLDAAYLALDGNATPATLPRLSLALDLANPGAGQLVQDKTSGLQIGTVSLGMAASTSGAALVLTPVLVMTGVTLATGTVLGTVQLAPGPGATWQVTVDGQAWTPTRSLAAANTLLNALMQTLSAAVQQGFPQLEAAIGVLQDLGIVQALHSGARSAGAGTAFGINPQAWAGLLANPADFLQGQFAAVLADPARLGPMLRQVIDLFGLDKLQIPVLQAHPGLAKAIGLLLEAFGILQAAGGGSVPSFANLLALAQDPAGYLAQQGIALLGDLPRQQALVSRLGAIPGLDGLAGDLPLVFSIDAANTLRLSTSSDPAQALMLGGMVQLLLDVELSLHDASLSFTAGLGAPGLGASLLFKDVIGSSDGKFQSAWSLALGGVPGDLPAAFSGDLVLCSSAGTGVDTATLLERLPVFVLSTAATSLLNGYVLPEFPVAQRLLTAVHLARVDGKACVMQSMLPALVDPLAWLQDASVLGDGNGGLDFDKVGKILLEAVGGDPVTGPGGVTLSGVSAAQGQPPGLQIGNLPYGLAILLTADAAVGVEVALAASPTVAGLDFKRVEGGLSFSPAAGLQCHGYVDLAVTLDGGNAFELIGDYRQSPATLSVGFTPAGGAPTTVQLVPFPGFQQFLAGGTSIALLEFVGQKLVALYQQYEASHAAAPVAAGTPDLKVVVTGLLALAKDVGITDLPSFTKVVQAMVANPVQWLGANFSAQAAADFAALLGDLQLPGVTASSQLVAFAITPDVSLQFGVMTVAGKTSVGLWLDPSVTVAYLSASLEAGVAMDVAGGNPEFTLGLGLAVEPASSGPFQAGPELKLTFDSAAPSPFALALYPVGDKQPDNADLLELDLVPALGFKANGSTVAATAWVEKLVVQVLAPYAVDALLATAPMVTYLNAQLVTGQTLTAGKVLASAGLLATVGTGVPQAYKLGNVYAAFGQLMATPMDLVSRIGLGLVQGFTGAGGGSPASFAFPFTAGTATGQVAVVATPVGTDTCYGVQLTLNDLALTSGGARDATPASTQIVLQIGKPTTADVANKTSWMQVADPTLPADLPQGLTIYFAKAPQSDPTSASLFLMAQLVDFGVDIAGAPQQPLIDAGGVSLQEIELRTYFSITLVPAAGSLTLASLAFGAGAELRNLGLPLGPGFDGDLGKQNPVAASLLAAASSDDPGAGAVTVNPAFSAGFGYIHGGGNNYFQAQLYDATELATDMVVLPIQRAFGPIQCRELGVGWQAAESDLSFMFDGSVSLVGLTVDLQELTVGAALTQPATDFYDKLHFSLKGIDVSFQGGPVTIDGGLLETTLDSGILEYDGNILVKASSFSFAALGSFASIEVNGQSNPSLMVFLALDVPIGGPPYFFVTGLAGGFGYNRGFNPPAQDQVAAFPFVAGVTDPSGVFGQPDKEGNYQIGNVLAALNPPAPALPAAPPELHEYFLSAGIMFTSFELISSYALLTVAFGKDFEVSLLGLSTIAMPKPGSDEPSAFVYAQLGIRIIIEPSEGIFQASAYLSSNSFVIDQGCRLTGGFAFDLWFQGSEHPGDFVVTLGGYHPSFSPPQWYPSEPRLGFDWPISDVLHITGQSYFALTPSAVMAGGMLDATFSTGPLRAWFDASTDMLITWKPFTYDFGLSVDIGVSLKTFIGTFETSLGADVQIWGPSFRMKADITWFIISFTISIGDTSQPPFRPAIAWDDFKVYFLPKVPAQATATLDADPNAAYKNTVVPVISAGLVRMIDIGGTRTASVQPNTLAFQVQSLIPATGVVVNAQAVAMPDGLNAGIGVAPMNSGVITSVITATLCDGVDPVTNIDLASLAMPLGTAASSLWSTNNDLDINAAPISDVLMGFGNLTLAQAAQVQATPPIDIDQYLRFEVLQPNHGLPLSPLVLSPLAPSPLAPPPLAASAPSPGSLTVIQDTIMSAPVVGFRSSVQAWLNASRLVVRAAEAQGMPDTVARIVLATPGAMNNTAAYATASYRGVPLLGQANGVPVVPPPPGRAKFLVSRKTAAPTASAPAPVPPGTQASHLVRAYRNAFGQRWAVTSARDGGEVERAAIDGVFARDGGDSALRLRPGSALVLALASPQDLQLDGRIPVRVTCFDRHDAILFDRLLPAGESRRVSLPEATRQVVLLGHAAAAVDAQPILAGWSERSLLVQANRGSMLGDGVILRPSVRQDAPIGTLRKSGAGGRPAHDVVARNDSWMTTVFQCSGSHVQVDVVGSDPDTAARPGDSLEVSVGWLDAGVTSGFVPLEAMDQSVQGTTASVRFALPRPPSSEASLLLAVRTGKGFRQAGSYLLASPQGVDAAAVRAWLEACAMQARDARDDIESSLVMQARKPSP